MYLQLCRKPPCPKLIAEAEDHAQYNKEDSRPPCTSDYKTTWVPVLELKEPAATMMLPSDSTDIYRSLNLGKTWNFST